MCDRAARLLVALLLAAPVILTTDLPTPGHIEAYQASCMVSQDGPCELHLDLPRPEPAVHITGCVPESIGTVLAGHRYRIVETHMMYDSPVPLFAAVAGILLGAPLLIAGLVLPSIALDVAGAGVILSGVGLGVAIGRVSVHRLGIDKRSRS